MDLPRPFPQTGAYDRIVFDLNGNGRLDDDAPVSATRREDNGTYFDALKLVFKGEDGPVSYHLAARFYQFDQEPARLLAGSGGWYEGNLMLAGKKQRVQLIDNTVNGVFNDVGESPVDSDRIFIDAEEGYTRYLGRYLEVDANCSTSRSPGKACSSRSSRPTASPWHGARAGARHELHARWGEPPFHPESQRGDFKLPVGSYRVTDWECTRKDDQAPPGHSATMTTAHRLDSASPPTSRSSWASGNRELPRSN